MGVAIIEKEWAEVRRKGRGKVEDWSWTVDFFENEKDIRTHYNMDRHYINNEHDAKMIAALFEAGVFEITEFGGVSFEKAFE